MAAFLFSLVVVLFPSLIPEAFFENGKPPLYFEAAAVIITLALLGQVLELRARQQKSGAIRELMQLAPETAHRITDNNEEEVALDAVRNGDRLRVRPSDSEKIPVDGRVVGGSNSVDESMLTGDAEPPAQAVADKLGIDEFHPGVSPKGKHDFVKRLKADGKTVATAGDGINDAPALAEANVGTAMGTGTGVAIESAGVTLVGGDLRGVAAANNLSRKTMSNIRQNLFFAFFYNALGVPVAAGLLYPIAPRRVNDRHFGYLSKLTPFAKRRSNVLVEYRVPPEC